VATTANIGLRYSTATDQPDGPAQIKALADDVDAYLNSMQVMTIVITDETSLVTAGTVKFSFRAPFAMTLVAIPRLTATGYSTVGIPTVDINKNGVSILGAAKLTIDINELTSRTAAVPTTLVTTAIADDDLITFDIDVAGNANTKGLKVHLYYRKG
jgi:hypothetical protein